MEKLVELYEMASLNVGALRGNEKVAILNARLALSEFEQAMESFRTALAEAEAGLVMAA